MFRTLDNSVIACDVISCVPNNNSFESSANNLSFNFIFEYKSLSNENTQIKDKSYIFTEFIKAKKTIGVTFLGVPSQSAVLCCWRHVAVGLLTQHSDRRERNQVEVKSA